MKVITLKVNGHCFVKAVCPSMTLLEFLREELHLTGTKRGCDVGDCGCCTVLLDGKPILSCLLPVIEAEGCEVVTIEGISECRLHPVQEAMVEQGAIQCGFCTPAMVLNGVHLLGTHPRPTVDQVKECVSGTLCRCTGYTKIETAFLEAAKKMEHGDNP
ncbi:MAG: (2Fe-2S)-binding protein [Deltaproteobacteria bacterium]|nr:(2Fe-2S)-binding protein [Deltaproteobacteria bacterium]